MNDDKDFFIYKKRYPNTDRILKGEQINVAEFCKNAVFVIDTNALLVPYGIGQKSLAEISTIYKSLKDSKRVFVSRHSLREFAANRSAKISDIYNRVDVSLSKIPVIEAFNYPVLEEIDAYKEISALSQEFAAITKKYKGLLQKLQTGISSWNFFDPVTQLYSKVFSDENILDDSFDEQNLISEYNLY